MKIKLVIILTGLCIVQPILAENVMEKLEQSKTLLQAALKAVSAAEENKSLVTDILKKIPSLTSVVDQVIGTLNNSYEAIVSQWYKNLGAQIAGVGDVAPFIKDLSDTLQAMRPALVNIDGHIKNLIKLVDPTGENPLPLYAALPGMKTNLAKALEGFGQLESLVKDLQGTGLV